MDRPLRTNYSQQIPSPIFKKDQVLVMPHLVEGGDLWFSRTIFPNKYLVLFVKKDQVLVLLCLVEGENSKFPRTIMLLQNNLLCL